MTYETVDLKQLRIHIIQNGIFKENCYIVERIETKFSIIIDPGSDAEQINDYLVNKNLTVEKIILTHGHFDHIGAVDYLTEKNQINCWASALEKKLIRQASIYAFRIANQRLAPPININYFTDNSEISWSGGVISLMSTPGHTSGSLCYVFDEMAIFTGDTVFNSFIGPSIYTESNYNHLIDSVSYIMKEIDDKCTIFPGHGKPWLGKPAKAWWEANKKKPPQFRIFDK